MLLINWHLRVAHCVLHAESTGCFQTTRAGSGLAFKGWCAGVESIQHWLL